MAATPSSWSPPSFTPKPPSTACLPDPSTIPTLLGKSNFTTWQSAILTPLTSNPHSNALLFDGWSDPVFRLSTHTGASTSPSPSPTSVYFSPFSTPFSTSSSRSLPLPSPSYLHASPHPNDILATFQTNHHARELANLQTSRFIRATLAMNVVPFVRQHTSARALWEQLLYLYGECCGIEMVGGPAVFGVIDMKGVKLESVPGLQKDLGKSKTVTKAGERKREVFNRGTATVSTLGPRDYFDDRAAVVNFPISPGHSEREMKLSPFTPIYIKPKTKSSIDSAPKPKKKVTFSSPFHFRKPIQNDTSTTQSPLPTTSATHLKKATLNSCKNKASLTKTEAGDKTSLRKRQNKNLEMEMKSLMLNQEAKTPVNTPIEERKNAGSR